MSLDNCVEWFNFPSNWHPFTTPECCIYVYTMFDNWQRSKLQQCNFTAIENSACVVSLLHSAKLRINCWISVAILIVSNHQPLTHVHNWTLTHHSFVYFKLYKWHGICDHKNIVSLLYVYCTHSINSRRSILNINGNW